jgi:hypothetical protein
MAKMKVIDPRVNADGPGAVFVDGIQIEQNS